MQAAYVREAYRLLQKSIIFVESADIELDDNEDVSVLCCIDVFVVVC